MIEYEVLTQKDRAFSGKFSPERLDFKWDTESWFGEGLAMSVDPATLPPEV